MYTFEDYKLYIIDKENIFVRRCCILKDHYDNEGWKVKFIFKKDITIEVSTPNVVPVVPP